METNNATDNRPASPPWQVLAVGILAIAAICIVALLCGEDGVIAAGSFAIIGGICGFSGKELTDYIRAHKSARGGKK